MTILRHIFSYAIWAILALLLGLLHMRIVLGPNYEDTSDFWTMSSNILYEFTLIHVGLRVGSIIAFIFILVDVFHLKKKLVNNSKATMIRIGFLLVIAVIIGVMHYVLEKIIDII